MIYWKTSDNEMPWVKYYTGKNTWYGKKIYKKEYLEVVKFLKGIIYVRAEQYWRLKLIKRWSDCKPYGWWR